MALPVIAAAAGKASAASSAASAGGAAAGAASGSAKSIATKGAMKSGVKKAMKGGEAKAKKGMLNKFLRFISHPLFQAFFAIFMPVAVILYQLVPSISREIKLIRAILALVTGASHTFFTIFMVIVGFSLVFAAGAAGNEVAGKVGATVAASVTAFFTAPASLPALMTVIIHGLLILLAWFIILFKYAMRIAMAGLK